MDSVDGLVAEIAAPIMRELGRTGLAEEEILTAMARHPAAADPIWHTFPLLVPTGAKVGLTEAVYRGHCRELLDRVALRADLRPGTAVECCVALCEVSTAVPLNTVAAGLYHRVWALAGLPKMGNREHYEALRSSEIDDAERMLRAKLSQPWRQLPKVLEHRASCPVGLAAPAARAGFYDQGGRWIPQGLPPAQPGPVGAYEQSDLFDLSGAGGAL